MRLWNWIKCNAEALEAIGALLTAGVAMIAAVVAYWQISANWAIQQEALAKNAFRSFTERALEHPNLANPALLDQTDLEKMEQYQWFMSLMIGALEEVLIYAPDSPEWQATAQLQISLHCRYFFSGAYQPEYYSQLLQQQVAQALKARPCTEGY